MSDDKVNLSQGATSDEPPDDLGMRSIIVALGAEGGGLGGVSLTDLDDEAPLESPRHALSGRARGLRSSPRVAGAPRSRRGRAGVRHPDRHPAAMRSWWRSPGRGRSHGALHAIPGIGRKRAERYGKDLLAITARRRRRRKASSDAEAPMRTLPSELPVFTRYYDLFEWGEALQNAGAAP